MFLAPLKPQVNPNVRYIKDLKVIITISISILLFIVAVVSESAIRVLQQQNLTFEIDNSENLVVTGVSMPDFLFSGTAWWLDINTDRPVILEINNLYQCSFPAGITRLHYNHDTTNVSEYTDDLYNGNLPLNITLKP
jgi:hypothetical protein